MCRHRGQVAGFKERKPKSTSQMYLGSQKHNTGVVDERVEEEEREEEKDGY